MTEDSPGYAVVPVDTAMLPVDVEQAMVEWKAYQDLTERLIDKTDYQNIGPKRFKKKSAWRKYAKAFNLSCEIIDKIVERGEDGKIQYADFVVRATAPSGRYAEAWASCSRTERAFSHDQDIAATAQTRAENRAISDLIGAGEVSAEEMAKPGRAGTQGAQGSAPRPLEPANPASNPQKNSIARMLHQLPEADAEELCQEYDITIETRTDGRHYGKGVEAARLTGGTHGTASQLIDELLPLVKSKAKDAPPPPVMVDAVSGMPPEGEPAGVGDQRPPEASVQRATSYPSPPKPRSKADADAFMGRISAMLPQFSLTVFDLCEWLRCQPTQVVGKVTEWVKAKDGRTVTLLMQQVQADKGAAEPEPEPEQAALMEE